MKILVIEDEHELRESIKDVLKQAGHSSDGAKDIASAEERMRLFHYDCLLIDLNLPDGNGLKLIELAKKLNSESGIIIISARDSLEDRLKGLQLGADDYLVKPFHLSELSARVYSLMRRMQFEGNEIIQVGDLEVNPSEMSAKVKDQAIDLTKKEYDLLMYFLANKDRVLTKEAICEYLWGDYADNAGSLDFVYTHIKNLRKKMTKAGAKDFIQTVYGVGYRLSY